MPYRWPQETEFRQIDLDVESRVCPECGTRRHRCGSRRRRFFLLEGPVRLRVGLVTCPDPRCASYRTTHGSAAEASLALPHWAIGWDVFAWIGLRRFGRHWSVPQLRAELKDTFHIALSDDAIEQYCQRYQTMVAARESDLEQIKREYPPGSCVQLSIDGLQPEKGHETLYVVRELTRQRVWFGEPLLCSSAPEVLRLFVRARTLAEQLGVRVELWMSDKQDAFVTGIAAEFPDVPHRYCQNHFLRDVAVKVLEQDSQAKVKMRGKVRGLRAIERAVLERQQAQAAAEDSGELAANPVSQEVPELLPATVEPSPPTSVAIESVAIESSDAHQALSKGKTAIRGETSLATTPVRNTADAVILDYCAAVRGILNDDQGGPLHPPGLRMASALREVRESLARLVAAKKGGSRNVN